MNRRPCDMILFGGSSGSLEVLLKILPHLKKELPFALVIILHRKHSSDSTLLELLTIKSSLPVKEIEDKDPVLPGLVYLAPADYHLLIEKEHVFALDDSEKIKGLSGIKKICLEEFSQFDLADFKQVKKRLRGKLGQKIIGIFNPISEEHWLKKSVFDKEVLVEVPTNIQGKWINRPANGKEANTVILKTCYLDNKYIVGDWAVNPQGELVQVGGFVDQHTIDDFEKDKIDDFDYYNIYGLGNWGRLRTGGEFWKDINANLHFKTLEWDEELALHITWDENVNPYLTCLVWQIKKVELSDKTFVNYVRQIDEICLEDPRNRVKHVCAEFKKRYPRGSVPKLFIYGDRTSIKESTIKEKGENFFTEIKGHLQEYEPTLRMQSVNPSVITSGGFVNECYAGKVPEVIMEIGLNNKKKTHAVTKVSFEEFGHPSDAKRYFMVMAFASEYARYQRGGKAQKIRTGKNVHKNSY